MSVVSVEIKKHRVGVHFFRYGVHFKLRRRFWWGHLNVKFVQEADLGRPGIRYALWVGWWSSQKGERTGVSGFKLAFTVVRSLKPRSTLNVPIYPRMDNQGNSLHETESNVG